MLETKTLAERIKELGSIKVLDLHQAALSRGMLQPWVHDGVYYILPPEGITGAELQRLMDEYKGRGELHLTYNAQSEMDTPHKPILPMDSYSEKYFSSPPHGFIKLDVKSRYKLDELNAIIDAFKKPFDASEFPFINDILLTEYKMPAEGRQSSVSIKLRHDDWKQLIALEDALKTYLAEINMVREMLVNRHGVKGLQPEVILISTEETTDKGRKFFADLVEYLQSHGQGEGAVIRQADEAPVHESNELADVARMAREKGREAPPPTSAQLYRTALETLGGTLKEFKEFEKAEQTISGNMLLIQFKGGFLGLGGGFGGGHTKTLEKVYGGVRQIPGLESGYVLFYRYDPSTKVLTVRAGPENERVPGGWKGL